ncbi:unnamed protein product, partial [Ectocarpus sp. 12 AP-2014]
RSDFWLAALTPSARLWSRLRIWNRRGSILCSGCGPSFGRSISCRKSTAGNPADAPRIAPVPSRCFCCWSDGWIWRNEPPCLFWTVRVVEG